MYNVSVRLLPAEKGLASQSIRNYLSALRNAQILRGFLTLENDRLSPSSEEYKLVLHAKGPSAQPAHRVRDSQSQWPCSGQSDPHRTPHQTKRGRLCGQ